MNPQVRVQRKITREWFFPLNELMTLSAFSAQENPSSGDDKSLLRMKMMWNDWKNENKRLCVYWKDFVGLPFAYNNKNLNAHRKALSHVSIELQCKFDGEHNAYNIRCVMFVMRKKKIKYFFNRNQKQMIVELELLWCLMYSWVCFAVFSLLQKYKPSRLITIKIAISFPYMSPDAHRPDPIFYSILDYFHVKLMAWLVDSRWSSLNIAQNSQFWSRVKPSQLIIIVTFP